MKHNVNKIPTHVRGRLMTFGDRVVVAACTRQFCAEDVRKGVLRKFGIPVEDIEIAMGAKGVFKPAANAGRYSHKNCSNTVIVHKNEPKIEREFEWDAQDWHGNPRVVTYYRDCYRRSTIYPKHIKITTQVIRIELDRVVVAFRVEEPISKVSPDFNSRLLAGLNLLQENVGTCNVELAEADISRYQHVLNVPWQVFPPGTLSDVELACLIFKKRPNFIDEKILKAVVDRYDFLQSLQPKEIVVGLDSFHGYVGALFDNDIVVFDNVRFGNAVYILRGEWKSLSHKSKGELMMHKKGICRIPHDSHWKQKVCRQLKHFLSERETT